MLDTYEEIISCPYNMSHQIRRGRMQVHLTKCRKQYPQSENMTCPFEATHVFPKLEFNIHCALCPNRSVLDDAIIKVESSTSRPPVIHSELINIKSEENWDEVEVARPILDVIQERAREKNVLLHKNGVPPSERRLHRQEERLRHQRILSK